MPIRVACPSCGRAGRVPDEAIGRNVQCPACKHRYVLTAASAVPDDLELIDDEAPVAPAKPQPRPRPKPAETASDPRFGPLTKKAPKFDPLEPDDDPYACSGPPRISSPGATRKPAGAGLSPVVLAAVGGGAAALILVIVGLLVFRKGGGAGEGPVADARGASATRPLPIVARSTTPGRVAAPEPEPLAAPVGAVDVAETPPGKALSTAEVVAESDPSIALIKGATSSGTGFLIGPNLLATNAHVIDEEFISNLEVRFPSADEAHKGPIRAELVYEDPKRDIAFLAVPTDLKPLRVAGAYRFRKGEEITVIGSPGLGEGVVLENAISRGVMSTKTTLDGQPFYQLGIAVNPGNSGGPVFDSSGRVIGVVTLKTEKQESLAFSIPVEDVRAALARMGAQSAEDQARARSRHRLVNAVKGLGSGGALYCLGIDLRRAKAAGLRDGDQKEAVEKFLAALVDIEKSFLSTLIPQVAPIRNDDEVDEAIRKKVGALADNFSKLKSGYERSSNGAVAPQELRKLKGTHKSLIVDLCKSVNLEVPEKMLVVFNDTTPQLQGPSLAMDGAGPPGFAAFQQRMLERRAALGIPRPPTPPRITGPRGRLGPGPRFGPPR